MNMISTGAFQDEMNASGKTETLVSKLVSAWEKKNAKVARAGGVSLMALSLAACGSSNDSTATDTTSDTTTTTPVTPVVPAAQTLTLSTNTDIVAGADGDDTISGASTSLSADDIIDGGAGSDTMTVSHAAGAVTDVPNITNVETINVVNVGSGAYELNLAAASGYSSLKSSNSNQAVTFSNIKTNSSLDHNGVDAGALTTASYDNDLAKGAADSVTISLANGADITLRVGGVAAANEFETYNISTTGSSANVVRDMLDSGGNALGATTPKIVLTGEADTTLGVAGAAIDMTAGTVDASAASGKLTIFGDDGMTTITGGSGDDTVNIVADDISGDAPTAFRTIDGGAGDDTLVVDNDMDTDALDNGTAGTTAKLTKDDDVITNFETLRAEALLTAAGAGHHIINVEADVSTFTTIHADFDNADTTIHDTTINVTDMVAEVIHLTSTEVLTTDDEQTILNLTMKDASGAADAVTVKSITSDAVTPHDNELTTLTLNGTALKAVETLNLAADRPDLVAGGVTTSGTTINAIAAANTTTMNITGSGGLAVAGIEMNDPAGATSNAVIDASGHSGNLTLGARFKTTGSDVFDIKLGAGKNSVDFDVDGLSGDKVTGSTGTDTVKIKTAAAITEMTVTDVDVIDLYGAGAVAISLKNVTGATTVNANDSAANTNNSDALKVTNVAQEVTMKVIAANGDWAGDTLTLDQATGTTAQAITVTGGVAFGAAAALIVDVPTLTITDSTQVVATGLNLSNTLSIAGLTAGVDITTLTLAGGGMASATAAAVLSIDGTSNVALGTIDATALESDLDINGLTTAASATVKLNTTGQKLTIGTADAPADAIDIVGGAGTDTIAVAGMGEGGTNSVRLDASDVEKISVTLTGENGTEADFTLDNTEATSVTSVTLDTAAHTGTSDHTEGVTISKLANNATVTLGGSDTDGHILAASANKAVTINATTSASTVTIVNGEIVTVKNAADDADDEGMVLGANIGTAIIKTGAAENFTIEELDAASVTTLTIGSADTSAAGAALAGAIAVTDVTAAKLTALSLDSNNGTLNVGSGGLITAKLATLDVVGDNNITLGDAASSTALLADVNASTLTGAISFGAGVDFAASADIDLGTGNDTITLQVAINSATSLDMGEKTSDSDTMNLSGTNNLGVTVVNLGASDQITQLNGGVDSAVQTGIENFSASGLTGSFGVNITGNGDANTLTGSKNADTISGGEGIDTITGGLGADAITLTETTAKVDTVVIDGGLTKDTVTGFATGAGGDQVDLDISVLNAAGTVNADNLDFGVFIASAAPTALVTSATVSLATIDDDTSTSTALEGHEVVLLSGATYAAVGDAINDMESSGNRTIKHKSNVADNDAFFFVYVNSTTGNATLAAAAFQSADNESGGADVPGDTTLAGVDLLEFAGTTAVSGFHADNFDIA
jgi:hypothetical protein